MNLRLLASFALASLAATTMASAQDAAPPAPAQPAAPQKVKTPLEKQMTRISKAMRALKKQIDDPTQNDSSLQLVATIHDAATASLDLVPAKATGMSDDDKAKFVDAYTTAMKEFIGTVDQLTAALKAGHNDDAVKIYQQLPDLEKKDHKQFRKPEKKAA